LHFPADDPFALGTDVVVGAVSETDVAVGELVASGADAAADEPVLSGADAAADELPASMEGAPSGNAARTVEKKSITPAWYSQTIIPALQPFCIA